MPPPGDPGDRRGRHDPEAWLQQVWRAEAAILTPATRAAGGEQVVRDGQLARIDLTDTMAEVRALIPRICAAIA
ncbi:MAG: hypothetical protein Q8O82_19930 [Pseudorhodobacter sp.]|nr:hypothetical protein [Pseudorhodobacter sp.]